MFGIEALDVVIGMIFIYLLFSLFVSIINEVINSFLQIRGKELNSVIQNLVSDTLTDAIYKDSKIETFKVRSGKFNFGLSRFKTSKTEEILPSELNAKEFSQALLRSINSNRGTNDVVTYLENLKNDNPHHVGLKYLVELAKSTSSSINKFEEEIENWYESNMVLATDWYKRKLRWIMLGFGFGLSIFFNVDSISIYKTLSDDPVARAALVNQAESFIDEYKNEDGKIILVDIDTTDHVNKFFIAKFLKDKRTELDSLYRKQLTDSLRNTTSLKDEELDKAICDSLSILIEDSLTIAYPNILALESSYNDLAKLKTQQIEIASSTLGLGWQIEKRGGLKKSINIEFNNLMDGILKIIGWIITALALSLGAPFWFDTLKRVINIKNEIKGKEKSEDGAVG
jgi:hypothetical protein